MVACDDCSAGQTQHRHIVVSCHFYEGQIVSVCLISAVTSWPRSAEERHPICFFPLAAIIRDGLFGTVEIPVSSTLKMRSGVNFFSTWSFSKMPSSSCVCLSDLETSRSEPGSRVHVQADNSFSARRRPVLWADIQDVVHCLLWGTTFTGRGVLEAPLQHGRAEPAYTRAKAVEGCPLLSRQVEARDAVWIAGEVVQSRRRSCQPIVFPAGPEPGLLRQAWGRQIAEMMGLLGDGAT